MTFKQLPTIISDLNKLGIAIKNIDALNISTVGVNTGNLDAFRSAIKGLSTEQAVFGLYEIYDTYSDITDCGAQYNEDVNQFVDCLAVRLNIIWWINIYHVGIFIWYYI